MTARLPVPGQDAGNWGDILNGFLLVAHKDDGTLQTAAIQSAGGLTSSQVGSANGVAGLTSSSLVPAVQLGSGTASSSNFLRGDGIWAVPNSSSTTLAGDTDVAIASPTNNQVLTYNTGTGKWINQTSPSAPVTSVAGKTGVVTLVEGDVTNLTTDLGNLVPKTTTVNGHALSGNVTVTAGDVGAVPTTTTVNGHALSSNVTIAESDIANLTTDLAARVQIGGDLGGTAASPTVAKVNGITLPASAPSGSGQVLTSTSTSATAWSTPASAPVTSVAGKTGVVTLTTADVTASTDKRYVTDAQLTIIGNTSGTNTGDQDLSGLVPKTTTVNGHALSSNVTITAGDVGAPTTLAADTDVTVTTPTNNQVLTYNTGTSKWINQTPASGVALDTTAGDIQPLGVQAAGAVGKAADAGHVHVMPRLDQVSAPTAAIGLNSQKITSLANGTVSTDAAAFGQIPVAGTGAGNFTAGNATVGGDLSGTLPNPTLSGTANVESIISANTTVAGALQKSSNLSDVVSASTARTNLGLGSAATQNKVAAGVAGVLDATDATTTNSRAPNGSASGDLSGTYPGPTVAKINGITLPASAPSGSGQVLTSTSTTATSWSTPASAPVSSVFTRTGAVTAQSGDYTAAQVTNAADKSSASAQTFTGNVSAPAIVAAGLTGATAASRYVGATASGAPASGTFVVGDFVIDQAGKIWICTVAGSPGTWTQAAGSVTLDSTATDIQVDGLQAAGGTGKAADAGHVHPTSYYQSGDQGLIAQTYDVALLGSGGGAVVSGQMYLTRIRIPTAATINNIYSGVLAQATQAVTAAYFGIYNSSGTLVASTANRSTDTPFASTSGAFLETAPLSSGYAAAAGFYWIGMLIVQTGTAVQMGRIGTITGAVINVGLAGASGNLRAAFYSTTGIATLPASFTPTTQMSADNHAFWFGLS